MITVGALPIPDIVRGSFRGSVELLLGVGSTEALTDEAMLALAEAAMSGDRKEDVRLWREAFPVGRVSWPELWCLRLGLCPPAELDEAGHDSLVRTLMVRCTKRGWALYQASRERSLRVVPFVVLSVQPGISSGNCLDEDGLYWPTQDSAALWCRILDCAEPFCSCWPVHTDMGGLQQRAAAGKNIRPALG